jgi:flagellar protein FlaG
MDGISAVNVTKIAQTPQELPADTAAGNKKETIAVSLNAKRPVYQKDGSQKDGIKKTVVKNSNPSPPSELSKNRRLSLEVDRDLKIVVAKIVDQESGDVIRQIPPEEMVELMKYYKENPGLLFNTPA